MNNRMKNSAFYVSIPYIIPCKIILDRIFFFDARTTELNIVSSGQQDKNEQETSVHK